jgi:hypothetical protein
MNCRRDPVAETLERLEAELRARQSSPRQWCGLMTYTTAGGLIRLQFVDQYERVTCTLGNFAGRERAAFHDAITAALERVQRWKQGEQTT